MVSFNFSINSGIYATVNDDRHANVYETQSCTETPKLKIIISDIKGRVPFR